LVFLTLEESFRRVERRDVSLFKNLLILNFSLSHPELLNLVETYTNPVHPTPSERFHSP
jgi:hypothetical protein